MNTWNAGQILSVVRTINKMDLDYLGPDMTSQSQALYQLMNTTLWNLARLAYNTATSDVLTISGNGIAAFKVGGLSITNMYEPLRILKIDGGLPTAELVKRTSVLYPKGWWCESPNQGIDISGVTGDYRLTYIRYPRTVTQETDPVDIPEAAYKPLIEGISSLLKLAKNFYEESNNFSAASKAGYGQITQAAAAARGPSTGGNPPAPADAQIARGT